MNSLENVTLQITIDNDLPYCGFKNPQNGDIPFDDLDYSIEIELLKLLISRFNFRVDLKNNFFDYGNKNNQTWSGTVDKVLNGPIHVSMCANALSKGNHFDVVSFTRPFIFDELTFLSFVPEHLTRAWIVFEPFYLKLWLSILIAWFVCSTFLGSLGFFHLFAVLVKQSVNLKQLRMRNATIFIGWLLASLILSSSYIGVFHSILTFPEYEQSIGTKQDLAKYLQLDDRYTRLVIYRPYFADILESNKEVNDIYSLIGSFDRRTKHPGLGFNTVTSDLIDSFRQKVSKQVIFIEFRLQLMWFRRIAFDLDKKLHLSSDRLATVPLGWIVKPDSHLLNPFNQIIARAFEMGIVQHWIDILFQKIPAKDRSLAYDRTLFQKEANFRAFKLLDLQSIFIVWSFGVIVSVVYFALEFIIFFLKYSYFDIWILSHQVQCLPTF